MALVVKRCTKGNPSDIEETVGADFLKRLISFERFQRSTEIPDRTKGFLSVKVRLGIIALKIHQNLSHLAPEGNYAKDRIRSCLDQ